MQRTATAIWNGSGKEGKGNLTTQSKVLDTTQYAFTSRFEQGIGTNPEELLAAAHAGCFAMKLSFVLGSAGFIPESIETTSTVELKDGAITKSELVTKAKVPDITPERFQQCADEAEANCIVSKALGAINVTSQAQLI